MSRVSSKSSINENVSRKMLDSKTKTTKLSMMTVTIDELSREINHQKSKRVRIEEPKPRIRSIKSSFDNSIFES